MACYTKSKFSAFLVTASYTCDLFLLVAFIMFFIIKSIFLFSLTNLITKLKKRRHRYFSCGVRSKKLLKIPVGRASNKIFWLRNTSCHQINVNEQKSSNKTQRDNNKQQMTLTTKPDTRKIQTESLLTNIHTYIHTYNTHTPSIHTHFSLQNSEEKKRHMYNNIARCHFYKFSKS